MALNFIAVNAKGERIAAPGASYTLIAENWDYDWFQQDGRWQWRRTSRDVVVQKGALSIGAGGAARRCTGQGGLALGHVVEPELRIDDHGLDRTALQRLEHPHFLKQEAALPEGMLEPAPLQLLDEHAEPELGGFYAFQHDMGSMPPMWLKAAHRAATH